MTHLSFGILRGLFRKKFRPSGVILDGVRDYQYGDDVRLLNWRASARAGHLCLSTCSEDIGEDILLALDVSASMLFPGPQRAKWTQGYLFLNHLAQLAREFKDKVGWCFFDQKVRKYLPPRVEQYDLPPLDIENETSTSSGIMSTVTQAMACLKKRSHLVLVSDLGGYAKWRKELVPVLHEFSRRHYLKCVMLEDSLDRLISHVGMVTLRDLESGELVEIDTDDTQVMSVISSRYLSYRRTILQDLRRIGAQVTTGTTSEHTDDILMRFLKL